MAAAFGAAPNVRSAVNFVFAERLPLENETIQRLVANRQNIPPTQPAQPLTNGGEQVGDDVNPLYKMIVTTILRIRIRETLLQTWLLTEPIIEPAFDYTRQDFQNEFVERAFKRASSAVPDLANFDKLSLKEQQRVLEQLQKRHQYIKTIIFAREYGSAKMLDVEVKNLLSVNFNELDRALNTIHADNITWASNGSSWASAETYYQVTEMQKALFLGIRAQSARAFNTEAAYYAFQSQLAKSLTPLQILEFLYNLEMNESSARPNPLLEADLYLEGKGGMLPGGRRIDSVVFSESGAADKLKPFLRDVLTNLYAFEKLPLAQRDKHWFNIQEQVRHIVEQWFDILPEGVVGLSIISGGPPYFNRRIRRGPLDRIKTLEKYQRHHLNQWKAFQEKFEEKGIKRDGPAAAVRMRTSVHQDVHTYFRKHLWEEAKNTRIRPTIREYNQTLYNALRHVGYSPRDAHILVEMAKREQAFFGLKETDRVPYVPEG